MRQARPQDPSHAARRRHAVSALLAVAALALTLVGATASFSSARDSTSHRVDDRLDSASCALLGRVWSRGVDVEHPHKMVVGCRVDACVDADAHVRPVQGEEVCFFGSQRTGPRYATYVDSRTCQALHRRWLAPVNMCASNPFRSQPRVLRDPACAPGQPIYLTLRETEGFFDECVSRRRYQVLTGAAKQAGTDVRRAALAMTQTDCLQRPDMTYRQDHCVARPFDPSRTTDLLITGESVLWRGDDEVEALEPTWTVDGLPGRQLGDLSDRITHAIHTVGRPLNLIVALGTNPTPGYTRADANQAIKRLGPKERVMFVLPFRVPGSRSTQDSVARYRSWMRLMAQQSPATRCTADWPGFVNDHPGLLVDGIHPAASKEGTYARFISDSWQSCLSSFDAAS